MCNDDFSELINSFNTIKLRPFRIYQVGDYEHENLVFIADDNCSLSDYVLYQMAVPSR